MPGDHRPSPLYCAISSENVEGALHQLKKNPEDINQAYLNLNFDRLELPIAVASRLKLYNIVENLLEYGSLLETNLENEGITSLQWACINGDIKLAKLLLKHGANLNHVGPNGNTALHWAVLNKNADVVIWLLEQGSKSLKNIFAATPLYLACNQEETFVALTILKSETVLELLNDEFLAFEAACIQGHVDVIQIWTEILKTSFLSPGFAPESSLISFLSKVNCHRILKEWIDICACEAEEKHDILFGKHTKVFDILLSLGISVFSHRLEKNTCCHNSLQMSGCCAIGFIFRHPSIDLWKLFFKHCPFECKSFGLLGRDLICFVFENDSLCEMLVLTGTIKPSIFIETMHHVLTHWYSESRSSTSMKLCDMKFLKNPLTLKVICRIKIRFHLCRQLYVGIYTNIDMLPLPVLLKNYLKML